MKLLITNLIIIISFTSVFSQGGVSINETGIAPNTNSILDVSSDTKGVLITRLTTLARTTLGGVLGLPDNGMLVYDKDLLVFYYWDGTQWVLVGNGIGSDDQNLTVGAGTATTSIIEIEDGSDVTIEAGTGITLTESGNTIKIDNSFTEVDGSITNEIQDLSIIGDSLSLTQDGTKVGLGFLKDHDWYEVGGTSQPDDINDDIFTQGKVGIGVVAPSHKLSVVDQGNNGGIFLYSNGNGGEISGHDNTHFNVTNGRTTNATISMPYYGLAMPEVPGSAETWISGNSGVSLFSAGLERVRLNSIGNVGIGVTSPNARFHVFSTPVGDNLNDETTVMMLQTNSTGNTSFLEAKTRRHTAGNDWYGTNMRLQRRVDGTGMGFIDFGIDGISVDYGLGFGTRDGLAGTQQTRMVIDNLGKVGIGTITPSRLLTNIDGASPFANVDSENTGQNGKSFSWHSDAGGFAAAIINTSLVPTANGLHVRTANASANSKILTLGSGVSSVGFANTDVMTVLSNGNVGIGTTTPSEKLHVQGSVRIVDGTQGVGKTLTSDANGKGSWKQATASVITGAINIGVVQATVASTRYYQGSTITLSPGTWIIRPYGYFSVSVGSSAVQWYLSTSPTVFNQVPGSGISSAPISQDLSLCYNNAEFKAVTVSSTTTYYLWGYIQGGTGTIVMNGNEGNLTAWKIN